MNYSSSSYSSKPALNWPPPNAKWLESEAMQAFRQSYRNYRTGHSKGAKGEVLSVTSSTTFYKISLASEKRQRVWQEADDSNIHEISIFQDVEDPEVIQHLQQLEQYRNAYRRFRLGESKGAEGELSKYTQRFSSDQLRLLPVAALARCLADQIRREAVIEPPPAKFHVHLGAGKLGIGLILPAIVASKTPFAIVQRPSDVWYTIINSKRSTIQVLINNDHLTDLYVIRSAEDLEKCPLKQYILEPKAKGLQEASNTEIENNTYGMLVLDTNLESQLLRSADAFSCSLGPGLRATLKKLPSYLSPHSGLYRPALYACENDHEAVEAIRELVEQLLYVKPCMVDRICSDRIIHEDKILVTTEPYIGEIIVTNRYPESIKPAFMGLNVRLPSTTGAYSYLYNRKFLLVNGTHTTLAFMTLRKYCHDPSEAPGDYELLNGDTIDEETKRELIAWAAARCLVLLHSHEVTVIKNVHQIQKDHEVVHHLWKYAMDTITRFSTVKDSTKRVLGGGVANRYETRLKAILETLQTFKFIPLRTELLRLAGFSSLEHLKIILSKLINDTEHFVTFGLQKHNKKGASRIIQEHHQQFKNV